MSIDSIAVEHRSTPGAALLSLESTPLYVIGGRQRAPRSLLDHDQQWYNYQTGLALRVEPDTGRVETCLEYASPPHACAPGDPVLFKSASVRSGKLYASTQTEVLIYSLPDFTLIKHISLPFFNDVHHVLPTQDGTLLVAISGLDLVVEIDLSGDVLHEWDVYDGKPWTRFSKEIDYRQGISTKPHQSHPNQIFTIDDEIWVTRFERKDAICLNRPDRRIAIGIERVHDGHLSDGLVYFTTVNGCIVRVDPRSLAIVDVFDMTTVHGEGTLLGWCRGILVENELAWVGFSRIRPTKFRDAVSWVRVGFKQSLPTHIACYDLTRRHFVKEIELESHSLNAVFSILPANIGS